jgi:Uma2 family endonuclease
MASLVDRLPQTGVRVVEFDLALSGKLGQDNRKTRYPRLRMSTVQDPGRTVADLLDQLGGISANRVRLHPSPGTATVQDVIDIRARERRLYELVDGVLVEKAMGFQESVLACVLIQLLRNWVDQNPLGVVTGPDGMMRLAEGLVRIPDVAFVAWERFPNRVLPRKPVPRLAPDLAVEVLSAGNTAAEMDRKRREYFTAGTRLVWLIDPRARTVSVYRPRKKVVILTEADTLDGSPVLPGFRLPLGEYFAHLNPPPAGNIP